MHTQKNSPPNVAAHHATLFQQAFQLHQQGQLEQAEALYEALLKIEPQHIDALHFSGVLANQRGQAQRAVDLIRLSLAIHANNASAHSNLGLALHELKRFDEAIASYDRALAINPDHADAHFNRGHALRELKRFPEAIACYEHALAIKPDLDFIFGTWLYLKMNLCAWDGFTAHLNTLISHIERGVKTVVPFSLLAMSSSVAIQQHAADIYTQAKHPTITYLPLPEKHAHPKIKIGYFSSDFRQHPVSYLAAELFERHDRSRFEIIAFSFHAADIKDAMRLRLEAAFDQFHDVSQQSDRQIVDLARQLEIDIAIDLNGCTDGCRTDIFALRAAPIQATYLGYSGTMGADYIDYIIADSVLIPADYQTYYHEKVVYLPHSYIVNDTVNRPISDKPMTRTEFGLPEQGVVFCCFNNHYKITPAVFASWMRILQRVSGSVLWLSTGHIDIINNLQRAATERGVDADRLIFAQRLASSAEHLARHRLADLFLDTAPYNAHTTSSDALWAGLPVLTCMGEAAASRVAASLLNAIGLPELITTKPEDYEALAIQLATHPEQLAALKQKLAANRLSYPLFNTELTTQHIESAYQLMFERYQADSAPEHIYVQAHDTPPVDANAFSQALSLHQQGQLAAAETLYAAILHAQPQHSDALHFFGVLNNQQGNAQRAVELITRALEINPDNAAAHSNLGLALHALKRFDEAIASYERALTIKPNAETLSNQGNVLQELARYDAALANYERALAINPHCIDALYNRGIVLQMLHRFAEALSDYQQVLAIQPDYEFLFGTWLHLKMNVCDWRNLDSQLKQLEDGITANKKISIPFTVLAISDSLALQKKSAEIYTEAQHPSHFLAPALIKHSHTKIRIGYFSGDFGQHPVSYLMAELFERHDRDRFEVVAFAFNSARADDAMRSRLEAAFNQFIDVSQYTDEQVVRLTRNLEIDIAIDLHGYTHGRRPNIFAMRAAPIQVSYLGYLGTMGTPYMDYLLADSTLIPIRHQNYYSEKIAYLPHSFQVNDSTSPIADKVFSRTELGLPEQGFVFCCFNNHYKITPTLFDCWMRLLQLVDGSVLWLLGANNGAEANLQQAAIAKGIAANRLVFAKRAPMPEYLAQHRCADLFLDTQPYNAGATASAALWAGLPVLTYLGNTLSGRMAASLLYAIGLPELIARNLEDYEAQALQLATHPEQLAALKQKLAANRLSYPLFNTELTTQHIESAYQLMFERYQADSAPEHIYVQAHDTPPVDANAFSQALSLHQQGQLAAAETLYTAILHAQPQHSDALHFFGVLNNQQGNAQRAVELITRALEINPDNAAAHSNLGLALHTLKRFDEAIASYECALAIKPNAEAYYNRGNALLAIYRFDEALADYEAALAIRPDYIEALSNRGIILRNLNRFDEALGNYQLILTIKPDSAEAEHGCGVVLQDLKRFDEAISHYDRALALKPDLDFILGTRLYLKRIICDWRDMQSYLAELMSSIARGEQAALTFSVLAMTDSLAVQKKSAEIYTEALHPYSSLLPPIIKYQHKKIRLGYFSADFHRHATAYLMAELFERHDRERFELIAFSFGTVNDKNEMRIRLEAGFDQFHDVNQYSDEQITRLARQLEIDIAVDLKGFTADYRANIFALRAAPIQVSYLGYPGTMGADYMDYIIADSILIPEAYQPYYTEKVIYLPDSYQVNDSTREIADKQFTRAELGLPEQGFVFCCFNNNYKITPEVFDSWMRIMGRIDGSVLWLLEDNNYVVKNLRREAQARGIAAERLVFAARMQLPEHLARHRVADLFLDTLPYNAHTTTSDALWAGLPVLTCMGEAFASRVAASLLSAVGLPELITDTAEDYEALAIQLATHPEQLAALKQKLAANRLTCPLFDTARFTRHIESAYQTLYERYQADAAPDHIYVAVQSDSVTPVTHTEAMQRAHALHLSALLATQRGDWQQAVTLLNQSLAINPDNAAAYLDLGSAFQELLNFNQALASYDHALTLNPDYVEAFYNRGNLFLDNRQFDKAVLSYDSALRLKPNNADTLHNRGIALKNLHRYDEAVAAYGQALVINPDIKFLFGDWLYLKMSVCNWDNLDRHLDELEQGIAQGKPLSVPFTVLAFSHSVALQKKVAVSYAADKYPSAPLLPLPLKYAHKKIRIGYFSADFYHHATAYLMAELFERHDKARFEIVAFSFSPVNHKDALRLRLENAFDRFIDVSQQSDEQVVRLARQLEIDIAIDLKGYTEHSRPNIFALRAAPIQVNYLGYPSTMGADYMDYLLADSVLIPDKYQTYYSEKIAYLPHSYQVNDTKRVISDRLFTRAEVGLPEQGFVFCCFNGSYKITPTVFDSWMHILHKVEDSVLWLLKDNASVVNNLRREAEARGINANRLIFAPRMPLSEHLTRQRLADLFLDTLPCNAHTTASDALWAGLPVLTCIGETFAGRVAASLLTAIGLPELITATLDDYETLAITLATHPEQLVALKQKLAANRLTSPLFDTALFTQNIESAYQLMFDRYQADSAPDHIYVPTDRVQPRQTHALQTLTDVSNPDADTLYNEGNTLLNRQQFTEAVSCYDEALAMQPNHAQALSNRGIALQYLGRLEQALDSYDRAIAIKPDYIDALYNRGTVLRAVNRFEQALSSYQQVLAIHPDYEFLFGTWLYMKMTLCEWDDFAIHQQQLIERITQGKKAAIPFFAQVISNSPQVQKQAADIYTQAKYPDQLHLPPLVKHTHPKIKIGYFSADFRQHPVAVLTAELFEYCDGERFEIIAFSFHAAAQKDAMRLQLETVFDQFIDVSKQSDEQVVQLARQLEIDIAVDLNGFTDGCRPNLFALRVAPVQVSYLGYLGTMGAEYIDYIIADSTLIPTEQQTHYREKIVYLPHSFQVNDSKLTIADKKFTRAELGLPAQGVVFCCFNNNYKITPTVFDSWMRILQQVDGSVLWLLADNASAAKNLQQAASTRGINPERLCFAERVPMADYLARQRVADLFLDTAPYNAGATASAALWAGLPLITCIGDTFAGRMGASLLNAIGLPELITTSAADYETLAIMLATHPKQLDALKRKLAAHRLTHPLFNTALFSRHLEAAYQALFARAQAGLAPAHIYVAAEPMSSRPLQVNTVPESVKSPGLFAKIAQAGISAFTRRRKDTSVEIQQPDLSFSQAEANTFAHAQCLQQQGQLAAAEILYNQLLKTQPQHPELLRCVTALEKLRPQVTPQPAATNTEQSVTHFKQAVEYQNVNRLQKALDSYERVLAIDPHHVDALINRGNVLEDLNRFNDALVGYERAIAAQPANARAHSNRGNVLQLLQRFDEALISYDRALSIRPDYAEAFYNRGNALQACKRPREAIVSYEQALAIKPDFVQALISLGNALHDEQRFDEALTRYDRALAVQPDHAEALYNRGTVLHDLNRYDEAIDSYNRALTLKPDDAGARWNSSFCYLILGDFANGWKNYEWRWQTDDFKQTARHFTAPQWSGHEALQGKTILLYGEQGLGDTLHFCRYAKQVAALGGRVILEAPKALLPLLAQLEGVEQLIAQGDPVPAVDFHSALLSLPLAFNTRLDSIPADTPYLFSNPDKVQHWQAVLGAKTLPRVGVVWSGNAAQKDDYKRSLALHDLLPLLTPQCQFISLQKEVRDTDRELLAQQPLLQHYGAQLHDFTDTAALIELMDVVITVCTSVAHLSAAMGKPTWLLLSNNACWRWLLNRADSPWYPTVRLFRQTRRGDWQAVIEQVKHALSQLPDDPNAVKTTTPSFADSVDALINQGNDLEDIGQFDRALVCYDRALLINPDYARAHSNRGNVLQLLQRFDDALASYDRALAIRPDYAEAFFNRGNALRALHRLDDALSSYDKALAIKPDFAQALVSQGNVLHDDQRPTDALLSYEQALAIQPDYVEALYNQGNVLQDCERYTDALVSYDRALTIQPAYLDALYNRGNVLGELKRYDEAIVSYQRVLAMQPDYALAHWNASICYLLLGDFANGWKNYEWRWQTADFKNAIRQFTAPQWSGHEALQGKTILLYGEQGLGDSLQFCRYVKQVASLGARVILEVPKPLVCLLGNLEGVTQLLARGDTLPAVDFQSPLLSLPSAFNTRLDSIPAATPYLFSKPDKVTHWQTILGATKLPRIGLVWAGNSAHKNDHNRSLTLAELLPLLTLDCQFISLQQELRATDAALLAQQTTLQHYGAQLRDFTDTAALIELMDVVISVDTSVAHLAAAMGKPTWILLADNPDWRWLLNRTDSPWYPSVQLFRQTQRGDWQAVIEQVKHALSQLPDDPNAVKTTTPSFAESVDELINQGNDLEDIGQFDRALVCYDRALSLNPNYARAHSNHGNVLQLLQRFDDALASYERALAIRPDYAEAFFNRGNALRSLHRLDDALSSYDQALAVKPELVMALIGRGVVLQDLKRFEDALSSYDRALVMQPDYAEAHYNRGNVLQELQRFEDALASYDCALTINPESVEALGNRGLSLHSLKRFDEALASYDRALIIQPNNAETLSNRGNVLRDLERYDEALVSYNRALIIKPDHTDTLFNRGAMLRDLKRYDEAIASYDRVLTIQPDHADAHHNQSLCQLLLGDFTNGWHNYEWRWQTEQMREHNRAFKQPLWHGEQSLAGKTILLYAEQGFGDTLQFCRYAQHVKALGATVLLEVPSALHTLLYSLHGVDVLLNQGEPLPDFDYHCPLLSLPLAFNTDLATIPADNRYIFSPAERVQKWQAILGNKTLPRIGLAWSGSTRHKNDHNRSIPFSQFKQLLNASAHFYSLQKDLRDDEAALLADCADIRHFGSQLHDFSDTAALCELMDIIISVDTSVAHLAGAMGKPVWILLPYHPDWRWMLDREDSPWYPNTRLFRQSAPHDWQTVLDKVNQHTLSAWSATQHNLSENDPDTFQHAMRLHQQGQLAAAAALYEDILHTQPQHIDVLHFSGVLKNQQGQAQRAVELISQSLALYPDNAAAHSNLALALQSLHRLDDALACYDKVLALTPDNVDALLIRGNLLLTLNRPVDALNSYDTLLALRPNSIDALSGRGIALQMLNRFDTALLDYDRILAIDPHHAEALFGRANVLYKLKRLDDALISYERSLAINPDSAEALYNQGLLLAELNRIDDAISNYQRTLAIKPDYAEVHNNLGSLFKKQERYTEAASSYQHAIASKPDYMEAYCNLITLLKDQGRTNDAQATINAALAAIPDSLELRFIQLIMSLPMVTHNVTEAASVATHFDTALTDLENWLTQSPDHQHSLTNADLLPLPFLLAYRTGNHVQRLARYGDIVAVQGNAVSVDKTRTKLKMVVVSHHFHRHSVWDVITRGLLVNIDRNRFELVLYHLGGLEDQETAFAKSLADVWRDTQTVNDVHGWLSVLADDKPDVIFYPEIGMDPMSARLAAHRLAPLQIASWGHPITTGLPDIDLYFSGDLLEAPDADSHYRERLIRLPSTGCCTTLFNVTPEPLPELQAQLATRQGISFIIPQTVYKFDPADDGLYADIAAVVGNCTFILLRGHDNAWAMDQVIARLEQTFIDRGLHPDRHLLVIPWQSVEKFQTLLDLCDVYLDCPSFSGYTTAWQAAHRGIPIVTLEGEFMRQRLAAGLLRKIGITDTIAQSREEYVQLAAKLADECRHPALRNARRQLLKTAAPKADNDISVVRAFEKSVIEALAAYTSVPSTSPFTTLQDLTPELITVPVQDNTEKFQRAINLHQQGRTTEAEILYEEILQSEPRHIDALHFLGVLKNQNGQSQRAVDLIKQSLTLYPNNTAAYSNMGLALHKLKRFDEAIASYDRALALNANNAEAYYNRGNALQALNRLDEALSDYQHAIAIKPNYSEAFANQGIALKDLKHYDEAIVSYQQALKIKPDDIKVYCYLINLLKDRGQFSAAETCLNSALVAIPDSIELHFIQLMMTLPVVVKTVTESASVAHKFAMALTDLSNWLATLTTQQKALLAEAMLPLPFTLAYRAENHVELLSHYGDLVSVPNKLAMPVQRTQKKLKIIVISHHFHSHSVWHIITRGLLVNLDRSRFELVLYHLSNQEDQETLFAKGLADEWRDTDTMNTLNDWLTALENDAPDVIFYPEIGMDPLSARLAARRLAPLQIVSWGHPVTTGLPDIDLYFSGDLLEAPDADSHYRERLIRLPSTGCCTTLFNVTPEPLPELQAQLATRQGINFIIPQTVYKFDPADDGLYADIAAVVGNCTFILLRGHDNAWAMDQVIARLEQTFIDRGLHPDRHLLVIPWQSVEKFQTLLDLCDVYLDCPSFSGYTTAWQAAHRGIPIVTLEGEFMRQRLAAGLLRKIGITDTIAQSREQYVQLAAKLADECRHPALHNARRQLLKTVAPKADNDISVVQAFEQTVLDALAKKGN